MFVERRHEGVHPGVGGNAHAVLFHQGESGLLEFSVVFVRLLGKGAHLAGVLSGDKGDALVEVGHGLPELFFRLFQTGRVVVEQKLSQQVAASDQGVHRPQ